MPRSYLFVKNDLNIDMYKADCLVLSLEDLCKDEVKKFLCEYKKLNKKVYGIIDGYKRKESYEYLYKLDYEILDGWWVKNSSRKTLNHLTIKARDVEKNLGLNFASISFISSISTIRAITKIKSHASYDRVVAVHLDYEGYFNHLGLEYTINERTIEKITALRNYISMKNDLCNIHIIDSYIDSHFEGYEYGYYSCSTYDISDIDTINNIYTPSLDKINEANYVLGEYKKASKKDKKYFYLNDKFYSITYLNRLNQIKNRSEFLGLSKSDYQLISKKKYLKTKKDIYNSKKFYTMGEEIANSVTHGIGVLISIAILILLMTFAQNTIQKTAFLIFALSSFVLYLVSTLYHAMGANTVSKNVFQRLDHMSIYLLIAGTYTPFTLIILNNKLGVIICIYQWVTAFVGILLNAFCFRRFKKLHMILYVMLGWTAILFLPQVYSTLGLYCTLLLLGGGISYTVGIIFYSLKVVKYTHALWHVFVLIGTVSQFLSLLLYIL